LEHDWDDGGGLADSGRDLALDSNLVVDNETLLIAGPGDLTTGFSEGDNSSLEGLDGPDAASLETPQKDSENCRELILEARRSRARDEVMELAVSAMQVRLVLCSAIVEGARSSPLAPVVT
jgi:hypothetical protein